LPVTVVEALLLLPLPLPLRSFDGVFAADDVRSEIALLSFAAATEGEAEGLMLQQLLLPPRCGVEWPESGMEHDAGAEVELGASGGRLVKVEEEEEAGDGADDEDAADADAVVDGSSAESIPPLLAPRR